MQTPQNSGVTGTTGSPHTPALSFPRPLWEQEELQGKKQAEDQLAIQAKNLLFWECISKDFIFKPNND